MIWQSGIWKEELQKVLDEFSVFLTSIDRCEGQDFDLQVEKFFFTSAFIIRKLEEANKLSDELISMQFGCIRHLRIQHHTAVDSMNWHRFQRFYDLSQEDGVSLRLREICNSLIHSFVFSLVTDDSHRLCGVFVNSNRTKEKFIYYIELNTFLKLINDVINDDIVSITHNRVTGKLKQTRETLHRSDTAGRG